MDTVVFCAVGFVLFMVIMAWLKAAVSRHNTRPSDRDVVQMTWADTRDLRHEAISGGFWKFIAQLEFVLLVIAALAILILTNG